MDHVYVASLMVISQEVEPDVYVFGSGVEHWVLCNANGRHIVYKDGNPTKTQPIILQSLFHPKNLRATASSSNIFDFCGRERYTSLLARGAWGVLPLLVASFSLVSLVGFIFSSLRFLGLVVGLCICIVHFCILHCLTCTSILVYILL